MKDRGAPCQFPVNMQTGWGTRAEGIIFRGYRTGLAEGLVVAVPSCSSNWVGLASWQGCSWFPLNAPLVEGAGTGVAASLSRKGEPINKPRGHKKRFHSFCLPGTADEV